MFFSFVLLLLLLLWLDVWQEDLEVKINDALITSPQHDSLLWWWWCHTYGPHNFWALVFLSFLSLYFALYLINGEAGNPPCPTERNTTTAAASIDIDGFLLPTGGRRWWSSGKIPAGPKRGSILAQKNKNKIKTREISGRKIERRKKKKLLERLDGDPEALLNHWSLLSLSKRSPSLISSHTRCVNLSRRRFFPFFFFLLLTTSTTTAVE